MTKKIPGQRTSSTSSRVLDSPDVGPGGAPGEEPAEEAK